MLIDNRPHHNEKSGGVCFVIYLNGVAVNKKENETNLIPTH